jgi:hypothetical protein
VKLGKLTPQTCASALLLLAMALVTGNPPACGSEAARKAALKQARRMMAAARREYLTDARCPFSTSGVVMRVGNDPVGLAAFVRTKIAYEPYPGSVRGPRGTLAARAGSDWDRALLLRALLAEAGFGSELVVLPRDARARLAVVDTFLAGQGRARTLGTGARVDLSKLPAPSPLLKTYGIKMNNRRLRISGAVARWGRLLDEAFDAGAAQADELKPLLAAKARARSFKAWRKALAADAAERVLLYLPANRSYLDVSPDAKPVPVARAKRVRRLKQLPAGKIASVELRVVMRVLEAKKKLKPFVLLKYDAPLASLFGRNLRVQVVPDASSAPGKAMSKWKPAEWHDFVVGCKKFQATLESGALWKASLVFDRNGQLFTVSHDGRIEAAKGIGKTVGGMFGGAFGGGDDKSAKPKTRLESLALEIDLKLPGRKTIEMRRLLYGPLRKGVSPLVHTDIVCFPGPIGAESTRWFALEAASRNIGTILEVVGGSDPDRFMRGAKVRVVQRMLYEWQLARLGLADRVLSANPGLTFRGGPAVIMKTASIMPVADPKCVRRRTVIDVACDGQQLAPRKAAHSQAAFDANVHLGAACTVFEAQMIREKKPGGNVRGAYGEFQAGTMSGQQPVVTSAPKLAGVTPTALARWGIAANQRNELLVFPGAKDPRSWWSVDSATGVTLGRGGGGEGMAAAEYLNIIKVNLANLKCMIGVFGAHIRGTDPNKASREWLMCVTGTDNPGNYVGAYGGVASSSMISGSGFSTAGDIIGGAWDVAGLAGSK